MKMIGESRFRFMERALFALLVLAVASAPALAAWWATSASPLVFEFGDNGNSVFSNPSSGAYTTYANAPNNTKYGDFLYTEGDASNVWAHTFSNAGTGSLAIQSNGNPAGRSLAFFSSINAGASNFNVTGLDWVNGIVYEIKAKSVGDKDGVSGYPAGYNWGGSNAVGGAEFNFSNLSGGSAALFFSWQTLAADDPNDDRVSVTNFGAGELYGVNHSLGGTPTSAPDHVYKLTTRKSPLPPATSTIPGLAQSNDKQLINVYVDGTRVITNKTVQMGADDWGDGIAIGTRQASAPPRGDVYDYIKIYEAAAIVDTTPPTAPTNLQATALDSVSVTLSWDPGSDPGGEVIGYRVYRIPPTTTIGYSDTTTYNDSGLTENTTYSYKVRTVDWKGNFSDYTPLVGVTTPSGFPETKMTFDFHDNNNTTYSRTVNNNVKFYTKPKEAGASSFWFGEKAGAPNNGLILLWNLNESGSPNPYQYVFAVSGGDGSLTIQTNSPAGGATGRCLLDTNDFGKWFKWVLHPNYDPDGAGGVEPYTYVRGMKITMDFDMVGDATGWCAPWETFPYVSPCTETSLDRGHQASDWGSSYGDRQCIMLALKAGQNYDEPGHEGMGSTGNGAGAIFVGVEANALRDATDDRIYVTTESSTQLAIFSVKDGLGLGLTPEDGVANNPPCDRDGVIDCTGNHMVLEIAGCNAGGDEEYWDIWITRPNGQRMHVNKLTCALESGQLLPEQFGTDGHTMKLDYGWSGAGRNSMMRIGNQTWHEIFGIKYNSIKIQNDWDGQVVYSVERISDLRDPGYYGAIVTFDSTSGGEKVISHETTMSVDGNPPFFYYIEQADRSAGIRIIVADDADEPTRGDKVSVKGMLLKDADGNLYVDTKQGGYCNLTSGGEVVAPLSLTNKAAGGKEVTGGAGAANAGLLATVWGKVSNVVYTGATGVLTFDLDDGSATPVSVADYVGDGQIASGNRPVAGEYWKATGILALKKDGSDFLRMLIIDGVNVQKTLP